MTRRYKAGESNLDGIVILVVLGIFILVSPREGGQSGYSWDIYSDSAIERRTQEESRDGQAPNNTASISSGNAPYSYQPYEEYITLENRSNSPINITGWQLKNGKDSRPYNTGGTLQRFSADIALIPQATLFINPFGTSPMQDIVLERGERAIITTGSVAVQNPYRITSFKENICSGYLETSPEYAFTPSLTQSCPRPAIEPGVESLDRDCRDFIQNLSSCRTPEFNKRDREGNLCSTCVNGRILSSQCAAFIKEHFTYQGCIANHRNDPNFSGRTWRVFLGRGWEMWNKDYETIELFDQYGQLVDFENY